MPPNQNEDVMSIFFQPLAEDKENIANVESLYKRAFPRNERAPLWLLIHKVAKGKLQFNSLYDNESWIGLISTSVCKYIVYVIYFAIDDTHRSGGFGSKVLTALKERNPDKRIVLTIEPINDKANNFTQRVKRKKFYEKNGYRSSGYIVEEFGQSFEMLLLGASISPEEIRMVYRSFIGRVLSLSPFMRVSEA
jgi:GNAT superfamily N-acetyltransferase